MALNDHIAEKVYGIHLQSTEVCFQAVSNQNGVTINEAQKLLLHLPEGGVVTLHILRIDAREPLLINTISC